MTPLVKLANVSFNLPQTTKPILHEINYEIRSGDFVILLGNNGSGKSTLLKLLYRYHQPDSGNIHFLDMPIHLHQPRNFARKVAVLTQNYDHALFPTLTVYENYLLASNQRSHRKFLQNYLRDYNENLKDKLDTPVEKLSGGEKQVLALALCFLHPPALLLLDEHTSALDPKISTQIMEITHKMVRKYAITCVLTTHDLDIALRYGNRILLLQNGKIRKTYSQLEKNSLTREELLADYY